MAGHRWVEVTTVEQAGKVRSWACADCGAKRESAWREEGGQEVDT